MATCCGGDDRKEDSAKLADNVNLSRPDSRRGETTTAPDEIKTEVKDANPEDLIDLKQNDLMQQELLLEEEDFEFDESKRAPAHQASPNAGLAVAKQVQKNLATALESDLQTITSAADGEESALELGKGVSPMPTKRTQRMDSAATTTEPTVKLDELAGHDG